MIEDENTIKFLSGEHLAFSRIYLEDTRGELSAMVDVDKWALSSCLVCSFESFGDSNSPPSTNLIFF